MFRSLCLDYDLCQPLRPRSLDISLVIWPIGSLVTTLTGIPGFPSYAPKIYLKKKILNIESELWYQKPPQGGSILPSQQENVRVDVKQYYFCESQSCHISMLSVSTQRPHTYCLHIQTHAHKPHFNMFSTSKHTEKLTLNQVWCNTLCIQTI